MKSFSTLTGLLDKDGSHAFTKVMGLVVVAGTLVLLATGRIDRSEEATVLGALIVSVFGLDGWKRHVNTRVNGTRGNGGT